MNKLNYFLMCLEDNKARKTTKLFFILSNIFLFCGFFANLISMLISADNERKNIFLILPFFILWIGFWVVYKSVYLYSKNAQKEKIKDNEVLTNYITVFYAYIKTLKKYLYICIGSFAVMIILIIIGVLYDTEIILMLSPLTIIVLCISFIIYDVKLIKFEKDDFRRKVLQARKEQLATINDKEAKRLSNLFAGGDKQLDYMYPLKDMKKKAEKKIFKFIICVFVTSLFAVITIIFSFFKGDKKNIINIGIIVFAVLMMGIFIGSLLFSKAQEKFFVENKNKIKEFGDRYLANLNYIKAYEKTIEKTKKVQLYYISLPIILSSIAFIIGAIIGVQNKLGLVITIIAGITFIGAIVFSNIYTIKTSTNGSDELTQLQILIDEQEERVKQQEEELAKVENELNNIIF